MLVALIGLALRCDPQLNPAAPTKEAYSLTVDRGKPIPLTGVVFGDPGVIPVGVNAAQPLKIAFSANDCFDHLAALTRCVTRGSRIGNCELAYTNSQGRRDYTVQFRRVAVTSIVIPGASRDAKTLGEITWTMEPADEKFHYEFGGSPQGVSDRDRSRIDRAHERVEASMWNAVRHLNWHVKDMQPASVKSSPFTLSSEGQDIDGVQIVGPVILARGEDNKPQFAPISLLMDRDHGNRYTAGVKYPNLELRLNRSDTDGDLRIVLHLQSAELKAEDASDEDVAQKRLTVLVTYSKLDLSTQRD